MAAADLNLTLPPWAWAATAAALAVSTAAACRPRRGRAPGPPEYPLLGALLWISQYYGRLLEGVYRAYVTWGGLHASPRTWTVKWPLSPRYHFTASPAVVEHVLKGAFSTYEKGALFRSKLGDVLGRGIFVSDGERWREQRKAASHMFSLRGFRDTIMAAFVRHAPELVAALDAAADAAERAAAGGDGGPAGAAAPPTVDASSLFFRFTLDSIGDIAFGHDVGSLRNPDQPFARAFDAAQAICETRFTHPGWQLTELLDGTRARLRAATSTLSAYAQAIIDARRAAGDAGARGDVLSRIMAGGAGDGGGGGGGGAAAAPPDDGYLRDVVTNFMIAGRDTTAGALGWATLLVASHPPVQARLAEEAAALFAAAGVAAPDYTPLGYDAAARGLPYATAVVLETLRLFPSVPLDLKAAVRDDVLPDGTAVAAGEVVAWCPFAMGHSRALWGADAGVFDPHRFLVRPGGEGGDGGDSDGGDGGAAVPAKPNPFRYPVFNAGPRTCLGQQMALTEAAFVLAVVAHRFHVRLAPDVEPGVRAWLAASAAGDPDRPATPVPFQESLTLPMRDGLRVVVTRRQRA